MMRRGRGAGVLRRATALAIWVATPCVAVEDVVDPFHCPDGSIGSNVKSTADKAQTVTIGQEGRIVSLTVFVAPGAGVAPLRVDLRRSVDGAPAESDEDVLALVEIPPQEVESAVDHRVDVSLERFNLRVEVGDVLAIVLRANDGFYSWLGGGSYDGGARFFRRPEIGFETWELDERLGDFGFAVTVRVEVAAPRFLRGDANGDGHSDIADASAVLSFLFSGGEAPSCDDASDANDSGAIDVSDAVSLLNFLFLGGTPPPGGGRCGPDPDGVSDGLDCEAGHCLTDC